MTEEIRPLPDTLDVEDGYPSEARIEQIRASNDVVNAARWLVETFPRVVAEMGYGLCEVEDGTDEFDGPIKVVRMSTGGWSGQEELVIAVEHSLVGLLYHYSWQRGGHYEFRVPVARPAWSDEPVPQPSEDARLVDFFQEPEA